MPPFRIAILRRLVLGLIVFVLVAAVFFVSRYSVTVVNMIPAGQGYEEDQNPEPSIAVNPANSQEIVAAPLFVGFESPGCSESAFGILRSVDGAKTWALHCTMDLGAPYWMGDPAIAFTGDGTKLIVGAQRFDEYTHEARIFEVQPSSDPIWPVTDLVSPGNTFLESSHLPWVSTSPSASSAGFAVGMDSYNSTSGCNSGVVWSKLTASAVTRTCVSKRPPLDGSVWTPVVRTAIAADGTMYAATYRMANAPIPISDSYSQGELDVVVFRHDPSTTAANAFSNLTDEAGTGTPCTAGDGAVGFRVARCVPVPHSKALDFGGERRTYTHVALAVNPNDSKHLVVAWGDTAGPTVGMTLRVRESLDRGSTWGTEYAVKSSLNPALSINTNGTVAFAWQHLADLVDGKRWQTQLALFAKGNVAAPPHTTYTLSDHPAGLPGSCYVPYIGDYIDLKSVGSSFYGVFSASSDLDASNFPQGVQYEREKHVAVSTGCPTIGSGNGEPELTIDPYFFRIAPRLIVDRMWRLFEYIKAIIY
ncbi:MAG: hypothetical protein ACT4OZ_07520 [Gemmatimonadota bacterium]